MTDEINPELPPAMQPEVTAVVEEGLRRGWRVRGLTRNGEADDYVLAYELVRQVGGEAQFVILGGPDSAVACRTPERTFVDAPEDAEVVTWHAVGPASSILDQIETSAPAPKPYPRPDDTRAEIYAGASWRWLEGHERRRQQ